MAKESASTHKETISPAASVVVLRIPAMELNQKAGTKTPPEHMGLADFSIFMVERSSRSTFMPNALVFPGGRVETSDGDPSSLEAFETAARRECMEEASLDLSQRSLHFFDHWQTPKGETPRRFRARFFLSFVSEDEAKSAQADGQETQAGRWIRPADALHAATNKQVLLAPPTYCILLDLLRNSWGHLAKRNFEILENPLQPIWVSANESHSSIVLLPHDPDFPGSPFSNSPEQLSRCRAWPTRFVKSETGWNPQSANGTPFSAQ